MREFDGKTRRSFLAVCGVSVAAASPIEKEIATAVCADCPNPCKKVDHSEEHATRTLSTESSKDLMGTQAYDVVKAQLYHQLEVGSGIAEGEYGYKCFDTSPEHFLSGNLNNVSAKGSGLYAPESFLVQRFGVVFPWGHDEATRDFFVNHYVLEFWIGMRIYYRSPLAFMKQTGNKGNQGYVDLEPLPLIIDHQARFYVSITNPSRVDLSQYTKLKMWVVLDGFWNRGVC